MSKNKIIIIADSVVLNPTIIKPHPNLSVEYSVYLNSLLISNWIEILNESNENKEMIILLSELDKDYISKNFIPKNIKSISYPVGGLKTSLDDLLKTKTVANSKTLIVFHNSIGLKKNEVERIFNLVQSEENTFVMAKSNRNKIILICTHNPDSIIVEALFSSNRNYQNYLNFISTEDIFIHTLEGYLSVDDFEDIKKLYIELSKKESLSYCSQEMHESFNDLFVEYKELLHE
jgi:mannose/fructose/N-acetylgalactosamine-specific phosphotransferase system component IIB